jgi:hypothetical protein
MLDRWLRQAEQQQKQQQMELNTINIR